MNILSTESHPFASLQHRNFRLFWCGQMISLVGAWMQTVGQSWLVMELTESPFKLGLLTAVQFLPLLLFSLFVGVLIDRVNKQKLILATQTVLMLSAFVLFFLIQSGVIRYWHILLLGLVNGIAQTVDMPARQAFVVDLVGQKDLMNAIALNSAIFNAARVAGPAVAGLLIAATGTAPAFLINGLSFLAPIAALLTIRPEQSPRPAVQTGVLQELKEGLTYIRQTPLILMALLHLGLFSALTMNFNVLIPVYARQTLGLGADGFGFLMAAHGVGATLGALFLAAQSHHGPRLELLIGGALLMGLTEVAIFPVRQIIIATVLLFIIGWGMITLSASTNTLIQTIVPNNLRGRVMSVYTLLFMGVTPLGSLLMGSVTDRLGAAAGFSLGGALGLAATFTIIVVFWKPIFKKLWHRA
jgi:predicted MFS family arabinose efflux permease